MEPLLEAFADAWNRHDLDAIMSIAIEDSFRKNRPPIAPAR